MKLTDFDGIGAVSTEQGFTLVELEDSPDFIAVLVPLVGRKVEGTGRETTAADGSKVKGDPYTKLEIVPLTDPVRDGTSGTAWGLALDLPVKSALHVKHGLKTMRMKITASLQGGDAAATKTKVPAKTITAL